MEGHQGDEYDEALSPRWRETEDIGWKVRLCPMDTQRAELPARAYRADSWSRRVRSCAISNPLLPQ